jgi:hypothetical protein
MNAPAVLKTKEGQWVVLGIGAALVVYFLVRQTIKAGKAVVDTAGGALSGKNALTQGTPYYGSGVAGTLGAGANVVSGGVLESIGDWLGGKAADLHDYLSGAPDSTASTPVQTTGASTQAANRDQVVTPNYVNDLGTLLDTTGGGG